MIVPIKGQQIELNPQPRSRNGEKKMDKVKEHRKRYHEKNKDKLDQKAREYRQKYKEKIRLEANRRKKIYWTTDPKYRLIRKTGSAMRQSLKRSILGHKSWEDLVGYTLKELKAHLEKHFTSGMSWANYGRVWHLDHKIPASAFEFQEANDFQFKEYWALENLQPLLARDNIEKDDKLTEPFPTSSINKSKIAI